MRLKITHETRYRYTDPPASLIEVLRLTPRNSAQLSVREWGIQVSTDSTLRRFDDAFGNITHTFSAAGPVEELVITAVGTVETDPGNGVLAGTREPLPVGVFLRDTDLTDHSAALDALAREAAAQSDGSPLDTLHKLNAAVHDAVSVKPGFPSLNTTADDALKTGEGVCQDCAHVFIAAARAANIPARYVMGYHYAADAPQTGRPGHAWAEAHVADLGWVGFDPTLRQSPDEAYVRVAVGLDYLSAAPVRGAMYGGTGETLDVAVSIAPTPAFGSPHGQVQRQSQSQSQTNS